MSDGPPGDPGALTWEELRHSSRSINRRRHLTGGVVAAVLVAGVVALTVHLVGPHSHGRVVARPAGAPNLSRLLLRTSDLPPGWSVLTAQAREQVSATNCVREFEQVIPKVYHADIGFTTDPGNEYPDGGEVLTQAIGFYGTPDAAAHAFRAASTIADRCHHVELRSSDDRASGTLAAETRPPSTFGSDAARWTLTLNESDGSNATGLGLPSDLDFQLVLFTRGPELLMLTLGGPTAAFPELLEYARTAQQHTH